MSKSKSSQTFSGSIVSLSLPNDLLERADIKAKELSVSRTTLIKIALNEYLKQQDALTHLPEYIEEMKKLQNTIDNQSK